MQEVGVPFSVKVDFIKTPMYWSITHMVAPENNALACCECHRNGGQLEKIYGVYIPGRDHNRLIDNIGWLLAAGTLLGALGYGALRIVRRKN